MDTYVTAGMRLRRGPLTTSEESVYGGGYSGTALKEAKAGEWGGPRPVRRPVNPPPLLLPCVTGRALFFSPHDWHERRKQLTGRCSQTRFVTVTLTSNGNTEM